MCVCGDIDMRKHLCRFDVVCRSAAGHFQAWAVNIEALLELLSEKASHEILSEKLMLKPRLGYVCLISILQKIRRKCFTSIQWLLVSKVKKEGEVRKKQKKKKKIENP